MNIQEYIERMKTIQNKILNFLDNTQDIEEHYQNLNKLFEDSKIRNNKHLLKTVLYIIANISNNHHRYPEFFEKLEKILQIFEKEIKDKYSNYEIFKIFHNNKRLLRFLIKTNILIINENIKTEMQREKYESFNYFIYLFPENTLKVKSMNEIDDKFENKVKEGENEYLISEIIRQDSINNFISYIEEYNYPIKDYIKRSIFETNVFLLKHPNVTLIEYAAFFGSIQIFEYLINKGIELTPSLWLYSIHGNNPKIIKHLMKNKIQLSSKLYDECIKESIKCHHNNIVNYLKENIKTIINCNDYDIYDDLNKNIILSSFHYYNFSYFPKEINDLKIFEYACRYDYSKIVRYLLNEEDIEIASHKILT